VGFRDRRLAPAQRFNLRAGEREASLEGLADLVVEARLAIVGDHTNLAVRFRGHPSSLGSCAENRPPWGRLVPARTRRIADRVRAANRSQGEIAMQHPAPSALIFPSA